METFDKQLRYFIKIAEVKSISRAAEDLGCTQPALSRQLAALEGNLGCLLFSRTGRGMDLTDSGRRVLEQVRPAFAIIDATTGALRDQHDVQSTLKIAAVHTLSYYFLGDLIKSFSDRHKGVALSLMGRSSPDIVELVANGKADVGFVYDTAVASEKTVSTPLFDDVMCVVTSMDSPLVDNVNLQLWMPSLIAFPQHYALRRMLDRAGFTASIVAEAETVDAMLQMVSAGIGACILPQRLPDHILTQYRLRKVRIGVPVMSRRVVAIERSDRLESTAVRHLLQAAVRMANMRGKHEALGDA